MQVSPTPDRRGVPAAVRGQGDLRRARMLLEEGLALSRGTENAWGIVRTLASLGSVTCEAGEYARAWRLYEESWSWEDGGWASSIPSCFAWRGWPE